MNPFAYAFFGIVVLIWWLGFLLKHNKDDEKESADQKWKQDVAETLKGIKALLENNKGGDLK